MFIKKTSRLKVGDPTSIETDVGPLSSKEGLETISGIVEDAKEKGAEILLGGNEIDGKGFFYQPTILTNIKPDMRIAQEETFGPVAPLFSFATEEEVIARANDTPFGLASYFYTTDLAKSWRVSEQLEYGMVGLNTGIVSTEMAPFGGIKESGMGREGSKYGVEDYLEIKYIHIQRKLQIFDIFEIHIYTIVIDIYCL